MESTDRAMSSAERVVVPLKSMCSMKCERPFCSPISRREPVQIQIPTETERTWGMGSVITRTPLASTVISISLAGVVGAVMLDWVERPVSIVQPLGPRLRGPCGARAFALPPGFGPAFLGKRETPGTSPAAGLKPDPTYALHW